MKLRIAFQKAVIEFIQNLFCKCTILAGSPHVIFVSYLKNHFVKRFFLISVTDFFVIVFDAAVFSFLLGIVFSLRFIKQLMVRLLNRCIAIFDVQMCSCLINIFCDIGAAIMGNYTITGHCTDCSFHHYHLPFIDTLIGFSFTAVAEVLLLLPKVTQKHF